MVVGYGATFGLFGGTAPLATTPIDLTGSRLSPAFYMMPAAAIGLVALWYTPETRHRMLD